MEDNVKTTRLHDWHVEQGANMANFGGYEMPLWYPAGARAEHLAVISNAGLFDTSHMAMVTVSGNGAIDLLQRCFTKDLHTCVGLKKGPLKPGRCVYGVFLNESGETIDDAIIYQVDDISYLIVVNAGMGSAIARHLDTHRGDQDVEIGDLTDHVGKMDIQGPESARILKQVLADADNVLVAMPYFSFKGHFDKSSPLADTVKLSDGTPILLSRTGYTGEFGFELFMDPGDMVKVWSMLLDAGKASGIIPCGLAARDSLRAGAVLPLSHQDIGPWPFRDNPWPFALPYNDDQSGFTKTFIGSEALLNLSSPEYTYAFVGNDLRKVSTPAVVLDTDGNEIGNVLTCATDMAIGRFEGKIYSVTSPDKPASFKPKGLCCGFVKVSARLNSGQMIQLKDNRRTIKVTVTSDVRPDRTARRPVKEMTT